MENIDEREIDAARFCKRVLVFCHSLPGQIHEAGLRLTAFLLFTELMHGRVQLPWSIADTKNSQKLVSAVYRAHDWLGLIDVNRIEWNPVPQSTLDELWWLVEDYNNREQMLKRLDYVVRLLGEGMARANALSCRVESFVAEFVAEFMEDGAVPNGDVVDLNVLTNGELGIRLNAFDARNEYLLPFRSNSHDFEVCLRLCAHNVRFRFVKTMSDEYQLRHTRFAFGFPGADRTLSFLPTQFNDGPRKGASLDFVEWFLDSDQDLHLAVIVLPTSDLRAKGRRAAVRARLLSIGCVVGIVDVPARVSGAVRLSMLIIQSKLRNSERDRILFMNGRAVDGLRDEPLDRLARFLSVPFVLSLSRNRLGGTHRDEALGEALNSRALKMFNSNAQEMPGFFRYVPQGEILEAQHAVLDPSMWIPEREPLVSSDMLDGTPVYRLLSDVGRVCCVYVIGNNGAGKSMLLRQLAKACCATGRSVRAIASAPSDRFDTKAKRDTNYTYLGARTSDSGTQPRVLGRRLAELIQAIHEDEDRAAAFNQALELLSFSGQHYLLPEAASSDLLESVREFGRDPISENLKGWKLAFRKSGMNSIVPFDHLSTGEQQVLLLTARLIAHAEANIIFLIDEPETSLHVAWQRALPQVFQTISRGFACQMVIATHSPVLISTARGDNDFHFMAEGGVLEEIGVQAVSSVERVLFQGFGTYTGNNREIHERCAELVSRAIEAANTSQGKLLPNVIDELEQMEIKITRAIPSLGSGTTAKHLDLIRRAKIAIAELAQRPVLEEGL